MKKSYKYLVLLSFLAMFLFQGCVDELLDDPFADPVEKFLGNWRAEESSTVYGQGYVYTVVISRNPQNSSEILISNFYYQGVHEKARALVTGNTLTIMRQKICDNTIEIQGSGTLSGGRINLQYTADDGADLDQVTAVYTKL